MSIKKKLLALVILALLITTLLVNGAELYVIYQSVEQDAKSNLQAQSILLAREIDIWFTTFRQSGQALSQQPALVNGTYDERQMQLGILYDNIPGTLRLTLADRSGSITNTYPYDAATIGMSIER